MRIYKNEKLKALNIDFTAPRDGDAGYDLYSIGEYTVAPQQKVLVETGLHIEIPHHYVGLVKDRSSIASAGLHTMAGVIDSSYRGEVKILLLNVGNKDYTITVGQKIAQMMVVPVYVEAVEEIDSLEVLSDTERGAGGFGSTGK